MRFVPQIREFPALPFAPNISLRDVLLVLLSCGLALGGGFLTAQIGVLALGLAAGVVVIILLLMYGYKMWWALLVFLLLGYLFGSKGFAVTGFYPLYVGEAILGIGVLTVMLIPVIPHVKVQWKPFQRPEVVVLFVFLAWQVVCTIPYVSRYQFDTLRDAMLYGYALFALIIMLMTPKRDVQRLFDLFGKLIPFILLWYPILFVLARTGAVPIQFPGAPNGIFYTKGSDIGVHLAGVGAYMLLQLDRRKNLPPWLSWFNWLMWSADVVLLGAMGRGIMVAVGACMGIVVLFRPFRSRWDRPLILGLLVISLLLVTGLYSTLKVDLGLAREVSVEQLVENVTSIFGEGNNSAGGLEGTKQWRLRWWTEIINYTFNGQYFWRGKGYGINLADSDGFQVQEDNSLRSPHNGHLTFLARSGVPGFVLWVVFQGLIVLRLLRNALQGGANSERSRYALWILAYLVAFGIEAAVDVFLEGPMGGIWFWAIIGFVLVYFAPEDQPQSLPHPSKPELPDAYRPV